MLKTNYFLHYQGKLYRSLSEEDDILIDEAEGGRSRQQKPDDASLSTNAQKTRTYLLRWNPDISSFKLETYKDAVVNYDGWFCMDWSIYEYEEAHEGDRYYMLRLGKGNTGIVWRGVFTSDPYLGEDWAGTSKKRYYVDIDCMEATHPDNPPHMTTSELQEAIPDIDWTRGHSGQLLTDKQAKKLDELWDSNN